MTHPFEFIVSAPTDVHSVADWTAAVRRIEDMGFHTVVAADHFTDGYVLEPMVALTVAAMSTSSLRVQTSVLGNDYRHPVLTARMAASLDVLSGGRLTLGLGAGWMTADYTAAGIPLDPAGERVSRLEEAIQVVRGLLTGEPFTFAGRFYEIDLTLAPRTVQHPLPLFVGGGSPRVLAIAGRYGDVVGVLASLAAGQIGPEAIVDQSFERVQTKVGWVRDAARAAGRDPEAIRLEMNHWLVRVTATAAEAEDFLGKVAGRSGVSPELLARSPAVMVGTVGQIVDKLEADRELLGFSCIQVDAGFAPKDLDSLAPVLEALAGR